MLMLSCTTESRALHTYLNGGEKGCLYHWRRLGASFAVPQKCEIWGGWRGTHCLLEL